MSSNQNWNLIDANIISSNLITSSDHAIAHCVIELNNILSNTIISKPSNPNTIFDTANTCAKQWSNFKEQVEQESLGKNLLHISHDPLTSSNKSWNMFKDILLKAAHHHITKIRKKLNSKPKDKAHTQIAQALIIQQLVQWGKKFFLKNKKTDLTKAAINLRINKLAQLHLQIPPPPWDIPYTQNSTSEIWLCDLIQTWHNIKTAIRSISHMSNMNDMQQAIDKREKALLINKKYMIAKVLERHKRSINLDRLIVKDTDLKVITNPDEVKNLVKEHFQNWTCKNSTPNWQNFTDWQAEYTLLPHVNSNWYQSCLQPITTTEILTTLGKMKSESAPGISGIKYALFKHLGKTATKILTNIFNKILHTGEIPKQWNTDVIYPISKQKDWEHNINITRPITFIETGKKIFTKIINNRLAATLTNHSILSPLNWAGLPGGSTGEPIHIINNILEDSREFNKPC